jgi:hypothetical protein
MDDTVGRIRDLTKRIDGFERLLAALKFSANADASFRRRSEVVIPQVEKWIVDNTALLASYKSHPNA